MKRSDPSLWQLSVVQRENICFVSGVVVYRPNSKWIAPTTSLGNALHVARSYFTKPCANRELQLSTRAHTFTTKTDSNGAFHFEFAAEGPIGFDLMVDKKYQLHRADISPDLIHRVKEAGLGVISDIDDTILESYTLNRSKSIYTTLFRPYPKRRAVEFTKGLFESLKSEDPDHHYVSRSEYNLWPIIRSFMTHNEFPRGPLLLTPFLSFRDLITKKKDPDFKLRNIELIVKRSPGKEFVLVGDDTQQDIDIYTEIGRQFKKQIRKVYIRQTNRRISVDGSERWQRLINEVPEAVYFKNDEEFIF